MSYWDANEEVDKKCLENIESNKAAHNMESPTDTWDIMENAIVQEEKRCLYKADRPVV
jgi:hypothetical protein